MGPWRLGETGLRSRARRETLDLSGRRRKMERRKDAGKRTGWLPDMLDGGSGAFFWRRFACIPFPLIRHNTCAPY